MLETVYTGPAGEGLSFLGHSKVMLKTFQFSFPPLIPRRFSAQLTTYALTLNIELVSIWILRFSARISED